MPGVLRAQRAGGCAVRHIQSSRGTHVQFAVGRPPSLACPAMAAGGDRRSPQPRCLCWACVGPTAWHGAGCAVTSCVGNLDTDIVCGKLMPGQGVVAAQVRDVGPRRSHHPAPVRCVRVLYASGAWRAAWCGAWCVVRACACVNAWCVVRRAACGVWLCSVRTLLPVRRAASAACGV